MGIRVVKTAIAAVLAMTIASALRLEFAHSAALLAILGVDVSVKRGIASASQRLLASVFGLLIASAVFLLFGYRIWAIGLFVLIAFPLLARAKLKDGIVTGTVVVLHVYSARQVNTDILVNEIMLLVVGLGTATLVNAVYMPPYENRVAAAREATERLFSVIFDRMAKHLRMSETVWDGKELLEAHDRIEEGETAAVRALENRLFYADTYWKNYFRMSRRQLELIEHMMLLIAQVREPLPQAAEVAKLFDELSRDMKELYYIGNAETKLNELEQAFRSMDLPRTRDEFEMRAALLQLCRELRLYLETAKRAKRRK